MSNHRPTFSDNWHRVSEARPRLRSVVQSYRHHYRGRRWHVLADDSSNQFFRVDDGAYVFVGLLDGRRTVAHAWEVCNNRLGDGAPTQGEVIQLLGQLYTSNLLQAELPPDVSAMFDRHRKRVKREVRTALISFLYLKLPLIDPNRFIQRTLPLTGWLFGPVGIALWVMLLAAGFVFLAGRWDQLIAGADPQVMLSAENMAVLYLCFAAVKLVHELGHGYACAHFGRKAGVGGQVHTLGVMMLVFVPTPYVDASSCWAFRNKWHRAFVGAGGMYFELAVAALAAIVWASVGDTHPLARTLAYNVMFVAGVSTILFNANPLLRFDGYYILSDILEIANLYQRAQRQLHYLVRKHAFGVRHAHSPAHSRSEAVWLTLYSIGASVYKVFITASIILYISGILFILGTAMALVSLVGWLVVPAVKFANYLLLSPELERTRVRAMTVTVIALGTVLGLVGLVPVPDRGRAQGVVEPRRMAMIHSSTDGLVRRIIPSGTMVDPAGEPLVTAENMRLSTELDEVRALLKAAVVRWEMSLTEDVAEAQAMAARIVALRQRLATLEMEAAGLTLTAPFRGVWFSPQADSLPGAFIKRGEQVGIVADLDDLIIRLTADQDLGPRIAPAGGEEGRTRVEVRLRGRPEVEMRGSILAVLPAGQSQLPSAALGYTAGGEITVDTSDQEGTRSAEPFFEVHVLPEIPGGNRGSTDDPVLRVGQRVVVRFTLPSRPLMAQGWRWLQQLLQQRASLPG